MSRQRRYETNAAKQAAYRMRKKFSKPETVFTGGTDAERPAVNPTIAALRALISEPITEPVADSRKPLIFRNDYGAIISEGQWNKLQEVKRRAKEGGYSIDEYSQ